MKRKIKLSFAELERELVPVLRNQMLDVIGGVGEPLPNGYCHFNMLSYLMYGTGEYASFIRDDMYEFYGRDSFVDSTLDDGRPVQGYDANMLDGFMRLSGHNAYQISNLSSSSLESELTSGTTVGLFYNNHAYVVDQVMQDGSVRLKDTTTGLMKTISESELTNHTSVFAVNGCLTTDYLMDMFPDRYSTTSYEDLSTIMDDFSTTSI